MASNLGAGFGGTTVGSSRSASVDIPVGTDLFIILGIRTILDASSPAAPTSCTVNGVAATAIPQLPTGDQNTEWISMFFSLSPPSGSQTVVVSGGGGVALDTSFQWSAYSGFAQSGQPDSSNKTNLTTTTALALQTTVVAANSWVIGGFASQDSSTSITNGVLRIESQPNDNAGMVDSNGPIATGSYTITVNNNNQLMNGLVASFATASASAGSTINRGLNLLGVGQ